MKKVTVFMNSIFKSKKNKYINYLVVVLLILFVVLFVIYVRKSNKEQFQIVDDNGVLTTAKNTGETCVVLPSGEFLFENFSTTTTVTSIGEGAFEGCENLTSITIPNSVTSIGDGAFNGCSKLTSVTFQENSELKEIMESAFSFCSELISIIIPYSVESIGNKAFNGCGKLKTVTIGNSVKSIGRDAFAECKKLTSITIPDSVTSIGNGAFKKCTKLTSLTIGNSVTSIGGAMFIGCTSLTSITIGNSLKTIGDGAFIECTSLNSINIPTSVKIIGKDAFPMITNFKALLVHRKDSEDTLYDKIVNKVLNQLKGGDESIQIKVIEPIDITCAKSHINLIYNPIIISKSEIVKSDFVNCIDHFKDVILTDTVTRIGEEAFTIQNKNTIKINDSLTSITIGNSVTNIGKAAFFMCENLKSVTFQENSELKEIMESAFVGCKSLEEITIPNSVTSIGGGGVWWVSTVDWPTVFAKCSNLKTVTFEKGFDMTNLTIPGGSVVFHNCSELTKIIIECETEYELGSFVHGTAVPTVDFASDEVKKIINKLLNGSGKHVVDSKPHISDKCETATTPSVRDDGISTKESTPKTDVSRCCWKIVN